MYESCDKCHNFWKGCSYFSWISRQKILQSFKFLKFYGFLVQVLRAFTLHDFQEGKRYCSRKMHSVLLWFGKVLISFFVELISYSLGKKETQDLVLVSYLNSVQCKLFYWDLRVVNTRIKKKCISLHPVTVQLCCKIQKL